MEQLQKLSDQSLLVIMDGYGINPNENKNAIRDANTPNLDRIFSEYPFTTIEAGGEKVGLPKGVAGNSEVGHMNLGAGKPVRQDLVRINESIEQNTFSSLPHLLDLIKTAKENTNRVHLMGLLSDGGVHSHITHIKKVISVLSNSGIEVFFHAFMDGRDTAPDIGEKYITELSDLDGFTLASMQGRSIGMDRDRRWEKIKSCYDTMTGNGQTTSKSPTDWLKSEYEKKKFDEFVTPVLFDKNYAIAEGDCCFFLNFRPDRAIQLTLAFNYPEFEEFERKFIPPYFLCMTPYIPDEMDLPVLFNKEKISGVMSEYLSSINVNQYKIAETEKYAHVTYFFNGGEKKPFKGEDQVLVPSPKEVETYDEKPEMSAKELTQKLLNALDNDKYGFYLANFANSDMVGHTGNYQAAVEAIEALDKCMGEIIQKCESKNIALLVTADHGNSDQMVYEDGTPHTSHTGAPVPFCLVHPKLKNKSLKQKVEQPSLMDVAPTVLTMLGIDLPSEFTGKSIF
ncbi:MAG: 2,3-bisphosphoglycerate-independent phosphoglycerate mutase [Bacteriovoracaceae bacterium]|nr:2,3-bisphosphoglycerate-independent phosphoglycerate mutase [Bacteriovoracaceae bacterium]